MSLDDKVSRSTADDSGKNQQYCLTPPDNHKPQFDGRGRMNPAIKQQIRLQNPKYPLSCK